MKPVNKQNKRFQTMSHYEKSKMSSGNQLTSYVFSDGNLIPVQAKKA